MYAMDKNCVDALLELVYHPSVDLDARDWKGRGLEEVARCSRNLKTAILDSKCLLFTGREDLHWARGLWKRRGNELQQMPRKNIISANVLIMIFVFRIGLDYQKLRPPLCPN